VLKGLYSHLASADLQFSDRIYPFQAPQAPKLPIAVYNLMRSDRELKNDGPDRIVSSRVQIDVYAATDYEALDVGKAVRELLHGYSGLWGDTRIQGIRAEGDQMFVESDPKQFRFSFDCLIWHVE